MDRDIALKLFKKYGFNSVNNLPYLSLINNNIGIVYRFMDSSYGYLERITFFNEIEDMDLFLKMYRKYLEDEKKNNISLALDNYQVMFPNILYKRNNKLILSKELMEGVSNKESLEDLHRLKVVAANLLNYYYDESKRQVKHINNVYILKNILIEKENILEVEISKIRNKKTVKKKELNKDNYFKYDNTLYNTYCDYLKRVATKEQAISLINNLWNLNKKLELSKDYYKSIIDNRKIADDIRLKEKQIEYVKGLNGKKKLLLSINKALKQIEEKYKREKISDNYIEEELERVKRKYSIFNNISIYYLDDYLKETVFNCNYDYIAGKYNKDKSEYISKNDIVINLKKSYQLLSFEERRVLTLFNSKYRKIFELILEIPDFNDWASKKIVKYLESVESISRFKEECIDELCSRLVREENRGIREKYFVDISFKTFRSFVADMVKLLVVMKKIDNKMTISGDVKLFTNIKSINSLKNKYVYYLSDNINSIVEDAKDHNSIVGIFSVLKGTPVLYSPYKLDFGNLYDDRSRLIKEVNNVKMNVIIDVNDVIITRDKNIVPVYYYRGIVKQVEGITYVTDIKMENKVNYCNFTIYSR